MEQFGTLTNGIRLLNLLSQKPITFDDGTVIGGRKDPAPRFKSKRNKGEETIYLSDRTIHFDSISSIRLLDPITLQRIESHENSDQFDIILIHQNTLQALYETRDGSLGLCRSPVYTRNQIISSTTFRRR